MSIPAFFLGFVCGMRAALGPALVANRLGRRRQPDLGRLEVLRSSRATTILELAAVGEFIGDKLPLAPARVSPGGLAGRALSGALCGAALSRAARENTALGAVTGAVGAVVGAYVFYEARRALTHRGGLPDLPIALAEDALALGLGVGVLRER